MIQKTIVSNTNNGSTTITGTSATTPSNGRKFWTTVQVLNDAVFTLLTDLKDEGGIGSTSVKAGTLLTGNFTAITLSSGVVRAYYGEH